MSINKKQKSIAIIDYGVGNLHSVLKAFKHFGNNTFITENTDNIMQADAIVLPGVGAFKSGMDGLRVRGLTKTVKNFANTGKPMLGICLGAQIMLSKGYEFGEYNGLDIIPGRVVAFPRLKENAKVPNIGWNEIYNKRQETRDKKQGWGGTILDSIEENSNVYFVHSYILEPGKKENILSLSKYGSHEFCSAIRKGNIYGCQFHPEKSGSIGLKIITNFVQLVK